MIKVLCILGLGLFGASQSHADTVWTVSQQNGVCFAAGGQEKEKLLLIADDTGKVALKVWKEEWKFPAAKADFFLTIDGAVGWEFRDAFVSGRTATVNVPNGKMGTNLLIALMQGNKAIVLSASKAVVMEVSLAGSGTAMKALQRCVEG